MSDYLCTKVSEVSVGDGMEFTLETLDGEKGIKYSIPFIFQVMTVGCGINFYHGCITDGTKEKRINHKRYVSADFYDRRKPHFAIASIEGRKLQLLEDALKQEKERIARDAAI